MADITVEAKRCDRCSRIFISEYDKPDEFDAEGMSLTLKIYNEDLSCFKDGVTLDFCKNCTEEFEKMWGFGQ